MVRYLFTVFLLLPLVRQSLGHGIDQVQLSGTDQFRFWVHDGIIPSSEFTDNPYRGLNTFAGVEFAHCFGDRSGSAEASYDIGILGAPHDTTVTGRPGARYGPSGIRTASQLKFWGTSIFTGRDPLRDWARVVDCGDAPMTWLDNRAAIRTLDKAHHLVSRPFAAAAAAAVEEEEVKDQRAVVPRIVALGGDHTTTLSALRSVHERWGKVSVIHFDSHIDTWDPKVIGGGISNYAGLNHGTFLHIAHEEGLILDSSIHAGIRAPLNRPKKDLKNDLRCGFEIVSAREIDTSGIRGVIQRLLDRVGDSKVYITVDIDVLDPAFAPATGTPEAGGWSTRELLSILAGLEGLPVVGGDVVEVAPVYDTVGESTTIAAAEVAHALIDLMVVTPVSPKQYQGSEDKLLAVNHEASRAWASE